MQAQTGPDIIIIANNHAQLYETALADVSDVAEEIGRRQGGWYDYAKVNTVASGRWIGVPQFIISWAITYREDWFKEQGLKYPETWDEFRTAGRALKAKGRPFGQAFGHSINDPNNWCYPLVWMWGGMEVEKDGKTVVVDSKAVVEAIKFNNVLWKEVFDEGGLGWDDSNNNRAFLSSDISLTGNAPSIYVAARKQAPDVYRGTSHGHFPPGPAGRFYWLPAWNSCVMKYSKSQPLAKDFIRFYMDRAQYDKYFETMDTFGIPGTKAYFDHPLWTKDPKTTRVPRDAPVGAAGWPRRAPGPEGHRDAIEVRHRRHVRAEPPGRGPGGCGQVGRRGAAEDLRGLRAGGRPGPWKSRSASSRIWPTTGRRAPARARPASSCRRARPSRTSSAGSRFPTRSRA